MYEFTAIDFETAQSARWSPCALGLAHFVDGKPDFTFETLIRPPKNEFNKINIDIHGITPDQTKNMPEFPEVWHQIRRYIHYQTLVAHNLSFDQDVLLKTLDYYELMHPKFDGQCTYRIFNCRLNEACQAYGIPLLHHSPLSDALACGQLFVHYLNKTPPPIPIVKENQLQQEPYHEHLHGNVLKPDLSKADPNNDFYGKKVVITGVFDNLERSYIAKRLKEMGGDIDTSVTVRTDIVIKGNEPGYKKVEKVEALIKQGYSIKVIDEIELRSILKE